MKDRYSGLIGKYLTGARAALDSIDAALAAGNAQQVAALAHPLKSSSFSVGARAVGEAAAALEAGGISGEDAEILRPLAAALRAAFAAAEPVLRLE
jgi:HPt (histidine-containing phosphotransfer) domain-containing protein